MVINYEFEDGEFEYDVDERKVDKALVRFLCYETQRVAGAMYNEDGAMQMANWLVYRADFGEALREYFEEDLYEYFKDDAEEAYENAREEEREREDWYGTKRDIWE